MHVLPNWCNEPCENGREAWTSRVLQDEVLLPPKRALQQADEISASSTRRNARFRLLVRANVILMVAWVPMTEENSHFGHVRRHRLL